MPSSKRIPAFILTLVMLFSLTSCAKSPAYEYELSEISFAQPDTDPVIARQKSSGSFLETEYARYYLDSQDDQLCNEFVNAQTKLLSYLVKNGVDEQSIGSPKYYLSDYSRNLSSFKNITYSYGVDYPNSIDGMVDSKFAYFDFDTVKTYKQVLTTLQNIYGSFTDYGYLYALSNEIAKAMKWETDASGDISDSELKDLVLSNSFCLDLTYPCFTEDYSSKDVIAASKTLSFKVLKFLNQKPAQLLAMPIEEQIKAFRNGVREYAASIGAEYSEPKYGYMFGSEEYPLVVNTTYFTLHLEDGYKDIYESLYKQDFFKDYPSIRDTVSILDCDISEIIAKCSLEDKAGKTIIIMTKGKGEPVSAHHAGGISYCRTLRGPVHEFCHYLALLISLPDGGTTYHEDGVGHQMFCEWYSLDSYFTKMHFAKTYRDVPQNKEWFESKTGREFEPTRDDILLTYNYYVRDNELFRMDVADNGSTMSYASYIEKTYGEDEMLKLALFSNKFYEEHNTSYDELVDEWKEYILENYA